MNCLNSITLIILFSLLISCKKEPLEVVNVDSPYYLKAYGSPNNDEAYTSLTTPDGGCLLAGATNSYSPINTMNAYLIRTDSSGNKLWAKVYGDSVAENFTNMLATGDGNYILCGNAYKNGVWINFRKIDLQGNLLLYKQLFKTDSNTYITGLCSDRANGYLISGFTNYGNSNGTKTPFLAKLDAQCNIIWQKLYNQYDNLNFTNVKSLPDGTIALTGTYENEASLIRADSDGNLLSLNKFGAGSGETLLIDSQGNFIIGGKKYPGSDSYSGWIIKVDTNNNKIWENQIAYYGYNTIYSVVENIDNSYTICGITTPDGGLNTPFIAKLYSNGNISWHHKIEKDQPAVMSAYTIHNSPDSGYYLSGKIYNGYNQKDDMLLIKTNQFGKF